MWVAFGVEARGLTRRTSSTHVTLERAGNSKSKQRLPLWILKNPCPHKKAHFLSLHFHDWLNLCFLDREREREREWEQQTLPLHYTRYIWIRLMLRLFNKHIRGFAEERKLRVSR